jgi:hypothetical protein
VRSPRPLAAPPGLPLPHHRSPGGPVMIAITLAVVTVTAMAGLTVFLLVVAAVRREERAARLPVEAPGPVTATARRIAGLHVRRTPLDIPALPDGKPTRGLREVP